jgi:GTPase
VVVGSKLDAADADDGWQGMRISAITGDGLRPLLSAIAQKVEDARLPQAKPPHFVVHRPEPAGVAVERDLDGAWRVTGRPALRAVALSDLTNVEALEYAQARLKGLGVDRALSRAGAHPGDRVRIGGLEFDYELDGGAREADPGRSRERSWKRGPR